MLTICCEWGQKHGGPKCDAVPGLIVHGYDALRARARDILYETPEAQYAVCLDRNIKGDFESHLDSRTLL